ncbi:MAG: dihydrofolate reductase [Bacilli bacterium]|nr:dihydrofolate reductase [Bacilli bacterium]
MNTLTIIAAIGKNNELGYKNDLIWHLPDDLKFFREKTTGKTIVMGYNTFLSLPKLLPNRKHIVLSSDNLDIKDVTSFTNLEDLIKFIKEIEEEVFIIGGASIYKQFIDLVDKMYLTEVESEFKEADVYFPEFNKDEWERIELLENENNNIRFKHIEYRKK